MNAQLILPLDDQEAKLESVGGKGASLARLARAGLPVPGGFYVTSQAYRIFIRSNGLQAEIDQALANLDTANPGALGQAAGQIEFLFAAAQIPDQVAAAVLQAYTELPGTGPAVAVRSSATAEDLPQASFAGQQETFLNVSGDEALLASVRRCWASLWTARAIGYRARQGMDPASVALAIVVQLLVPAQAAGILFTANPLSGSRDQVVINAAWGLGEAVVGGAVDPDTIVVDKAINQVVQRQTGTKRIRTVLAGSGTREEPVPAPLQTASVLDDRQAVELALLGQRIEALYQRPMDVEWAWAQGAFSILQARPITALPSPEPPPPTEWKLPPGKYVAMRNNIVELMADPLSPLFATLGLRAVNASMEAQLDAFMGRSGLLEEPIITVNHYAYYNGSLTAGQIVRIMLGSVGIMKRMFTGAVARWTEAGWPQYQSIVEGWRARPWRQMPAPEILQAVRELNEAAIDGYMALVSGIIPAAWITEGLFTLVYRLLKTREDPSAPTFLLGFDSLPIRGEKTLYDLAVWAQERESLAGCLEQTPTSELADQIENGGAPGLLSAEDWQTFRARFLDYLQSYGHQIYNLDYANPVPADDPTPVLETFKMFLRGEGTNPHTRQQAAVARREQATQALESRLRGWRLNLFRKYLERARRYAPQREDGLANLGWAYPLIREMLAEVGKRFVDAGIMDRPEEIYWLEGNEVEQAADRLACGEKVEPLTAWIPARQAELCAARRAAPPLMLPQLTIFGFDLGALKGGGAGKRKDNLLKGVAASPGRVTGTARVLHGPEDFGEMHAGEVLVAALTTPAWTPLFARAGAIVTDVGGPLSHGSIVAREYGIPAVLGTGVATKRIQSGQAVTVDGNRGQVLLHEAEVQ